MELLHKELTDKIIGAFYTVYNELGYGFLEKVYENAMLIELKELRLNVHQQMPIKVRYRGYVVGEYFADLCVQDAVILELKAEETLRDADEAQILNYLKATGYDVGLLLNFGPRPEFARKVYTKHK